MSDPSRKTPQQSVGGQDKPARAGPTHKPNGRSRRGGGHRKNEREGADVKVPANQPVNQNPEPAAVVVQQAPKVVEPVATPAPTPSTQPRNGEKATRQPQRNRRGEPSKSKRAVEQPAEDKGTVTPVAKSASKEPLQPTPEVPALTVKAATSSNDLANNTRSSRTAGSKPRGRQAKPTPRNRPVAGTGKAVARGKATLNMSEDDTSSSCSSLVPTPINSPSSPASTYGRQVPMSRANAPSTSKIPTQSKPEPEVHEICLDIWADNPPEEGIWDTHTNDALPRFDHPNNGAPTGNYGPLRPLRTQYEPPHQPTPPPPTPPNLPTPQEPVLSQPPIDDSPTSMRRIGLAYVLLGPGACVQHVFTDAESPWIKISNLPRHARKPDVQELVAPFGETRYVRVYNPKADTHYLPTARVLFDRHEQAKLAVGALQGQLMRGKRITVRLDTDTSGGGVDGDYVRGLTDIGSASAMTDTRSALIGHDPSAIVRSCTVKVTWYAPKASVYVTYQSPRFATDRVKELHGRTFGNRRMNMVAMFSERDDLARVRREDGGYVVRIDGLWADLDLYALGRFVRTQDIVVQPSYSFEAGLTKLRGDLSDIAPLESFKLLHNRPEDKKYHALAQYTTPAAAAAAVKVFQGRRGEYLANSPVWVSRHLTIRYSIPTKLTAALQGEINKLHSWAMDDPDIHIRQQEDSNKPGYVQVSISGNETKHVAAAKAQLDRALAGEPFCDSEGNKVWDAYLLSEEWVAFLESVAEKTGVCVRADQRTCALLLFGPGYARDEASGLLRAELARLAQLKRVLSIPPPVFRRLAGGGLTILRDLVGKGNIYVNVIRQSLTFYGDDEVVRRVKKALDVMYSEVGARLRRHSDCVICLCQPEGSILLHCGHHYCKSCFSQYVASAAENRTLPLVCVGRECKAQIPLSMITLHAAQPDQDALFYAAFQSHVSSHPDQYRYCPTADCQYIYRVSQPDTSIQCRLCLVHICTHCHVEHHEGISCEDYLASHSESEIQRSFNKWKDSHDVKSCPNCSASIEKIAGCNHMMCSACRTHMCWVCVTSYPTGDAVYQHMRSAHGGIGLQ